MSRRRRRSGYILLMTLVLIATAGLLMVGLARQSMHLALNATESQQQLQRRWGAITCQRYAFEHADKLLSAPRAASDEQIAAIPQRLKYASLQLELGGIRFDLLLSDEDAKANLNTINAHRDKTYLHQAIQRMSGVGALPPIHLRPHPARDDTPQKPAFESWGQVFDTTSEAERTDAADALVAAGRYMTCWGSGRLHLATASDESVREVAGLAVSGLQANQLLRARHEHPERSVQQLLEALELRESQREELQQLLADQSMCQSLWLTISAPAFRETKLVVREFDAEGNARVCAFAW